MCCATGAATSSFAPPAVKILDQVRAVAMRNAERPTPAYLVTLRKTLDMTQREFGKSVGVDKMTVSRWERGSRRPSIANARRIAALRAKRIRHEVPLNDRTSLGVCAGAFRPRQRSESHLMQN